MPLIMRYKLTWALPSGGPGVTTLFAFPDTTEQVFADGARAFMSDALQVATAHDALPTGCSIQGDSIVDNIEVTDGTLASAVPVTPPVVINGNATGSYSAPSGAVITWLTGLVHQGRPGPWAHFPCAYCESAVGHERDPRLRVPHEPPDGRGRVHRYSRQSVHLGPSGSGDYERCSLHRRRRIGRGQGRRTHVSPGLRRVSLSTWSRPWLIVAGALVLAVWIFVLNELVWSAQLLEGTPVC